MSNLYFSVKRAGKVKLVPGSVKSELASNSSSISTDSMRLILERLKSDSYKESTKNNYQSVWRQFNTFVIKLDKKPKSWEDRASLFGAYMVECCGVQSSTLKSYISAIKRILVNDGYLWCDKKVLLNTLTKACKIKNDRVRVRLPIQLGLLEILLFEIQRKFADQPYLECLYKTMFLIAYYGLLRISEITLGEHVLKAKDVEITYNKNKIQLILYSSKTLTKGQHPHKIKITESEEKAVKTVTRNFCPFLASREYMAICGNVKVEEDPFFIYRGNQPVKQHNFRKVLKDLLKDISLDPKNYGCHSFRYERSMDMLRLGYSLEEIKSAGRWKSGAVYRYLKQ